MTLASSMSGKIKLWCWVQGDELDRVFQVQIELSDPIYSLKEAIRAKKPSFEPIATDGLILWKVGESYWCTLVCRSDSRLV